MSLRTAAWLAWSLCGLTLILVACVVAFEALYRVSPSGLSLPVFVVPSALVGAVVASRQPRNPVVWFLVVSASCWAVNEATGRYAVYGLVIEPGSVPLARLMAWPSTWMWVSALAWGLGALDEVLDLSDPEKNALAQGLAFEERVAVD